MCYCYRFLFLLPILLLLCNIILWTAEARRQGDALTKFLQAKKANSFQRQPAQDLNSVVIDHQPHRNDIVISQLQGSKDTDKITKLPGQPDQKNIDFAQYGGYVTVDQLAGRALFYYFAEVVGSLHATNNKPLLLWLNGGPGCSSLGYGAMDELGPFRVMSDGKTLYRNEFSWNNVANVLFLESPAGVGFSYSNTTSDYDACGDAATAKDSFVFLVNWLERFPEYKTRDFYIAGESYAGHYVPQLAHTILERNKLDNKTYLHLKGIMIGNAVINEETDSLGMYDFFWTHALISDETINDLHKYCNFSSDATTQPKQCSDADDEVGTDVSPLDIYGIYSPLCFSSNLTDKPKKASVLEFDPCSDKYIDAYLNTPGVQEALHANETRLTHPWSACTQVITRWTDSPSTILPLLKEFMAKGLRVWVFSGDVDGRIPVTSTRYSLNTLQLPLKSKWRPWIVGNEVGGYTVVYEGDITLATVRGAGHEVPSYQPKRALALAKSFLLGEPLPTS